MRASLCSGYGLVQTSSLLTSATAAATTTWTSTARACSAAATTATHALAAATAATHALTATRATSADRWHATSSTNGGQCSGTADTACTSTHGATGTTSTTTRSGRSACSRRFARWLIFHRLWIWLRRNQSINGNHCAQINIRGEVHAVCTNGDARGRDSDPYELWHSINVRVPLCAPAAIAVACFHEEPNNAIGNWLGESAAIGAFIGSHVTSAPQG